MPVQVEHDRADLSVQERMQRRRAPDARHHQERDGDGQGRGEHHTVQVVVMIRRDDFARLVIPTAHTTDLGYCVHDYTASPCQLHLDCIHCEDLVCVKGDAEKVETLRQRLDEAQGLMRKAETAAGEGYSGSDRWIEHHRSTVERLSQLSKIMDDPSVPDGAVIQLSPPKTVFQTEHKAEDLLSHPANEQPSLPADIKALIGG